MLQTMKKAGSRFSLTLDEWTSLGIKRYININVHTKNYFFCLGLVKIIGCDSSATELFDLRKIWP